MLFIPRMFISQDTPRGCSLEVQVAISRSGICEVSELFRQSPQARRTDMNLRLVHQDINDNR